MDHHQFSVSHTIDPAETDAVKIGIQIGHIIFSGPFLVFAVPVFNFGFQLRGRMRKFIVIGRPEYVADCSGRVGLVELQQGIILFPGVTTSAVYISGGAANSSSFRLLVILHIETKSFA